MKKLTILLGVLALMFVPAAVASAEYTSDDDGATVDNQTVDEDTTFTVDVLAAIELSDPADDSDAVAPVAGGSNATADLDMAASLRSNLSWNIASSTAGKLSGGASTGTADLLSDLTGDSGNVASGSRNQDGTDGASGNDAQSVAADYDQVVSWGDEAGRYTEVITHTASQTLSV